MKCISRGAVALAAATLALGAFVTPANASQTAPAEITNIPYSAGPVSGGWLTVKGRGFVNTKTAETAGRQTEFRIRDNGTIDIKMPAQREGFLADIVLTQKDGFVVTVNNAYYYSDTYKVQKNCTFTHIFNSFAANCDGFRIAVVNETGREITVEPGKSDALSFKPPFDPVVIPAAGTDQSYTEAGLRGKKKLFAGPSSTRVALSDGLVDSQGNERYRYLYVSNPNNKPENVRVTCGIFPYSTEIVYSDDSNGCRVLNDSATGLIRVEFNADVRIS